MRKEIEAWLRKEALQLLEDPARKGLVRVIASGKADETDDAVSLLVSWQLLHRQREHFYIEELAEQRDGFLIQGQFYPTPTNYTEAEKRLLEAFVDYQPDESERAPFYYNRQKAVQYAEHWWNSRNPAYPSFDDDCTNFISQCLRAGGFPMTASKNRSKGWWIRGKTWSYSWAVAHALMLFLKSSKHTRQVDSPTELQLGDIICYDFEGDGRFNHNTIVTGFDGDSAPLVNAHTFDSRQRFWEYTDSSAYTPNIRYKFFHILSS